MLLEHDLPVSLHERAARVWRHRECIEREAAALFGDLAAELAKTGHAELANRAAIAATDELRHAIRCRELVVAFSSAPPPPEPPRDLVLGPPSLAPGDRLLYTAVAVGCITESLSCALLLALREAATHPLVQTTIEEIVRDEIEHARIGWAVLAATARECDVGWLAPYLPAISAAAIADDVRPMAGDAELAGLGVLPRHRVNELVGETWRSVIAPGLERHGIHVPSEAWLPRAAGA